MSIGRFFWYALVALCALQFILVIRFAFPLRRKRTPINDRKAPLRPSISKSNKANNRKELAETKAISKSISQASNSIEERDEDSRATADASRGKGIKTKIEKQVEDVKRTNENEGDRLDSELERWKKISKMPKLAILKYVGNDEFKEDTPLSVIDRYKRIEPDEIVVEDSDNVRIIDEEDME